MNFDSKTVLKNPNNSALGSSNHKPQKKGNARAAETFKQKAKVQLIKRNLADKRDLDKIETELRAGKVLFLKTQEFFEQYENDVLTLKNSFNRLKQCCREVGGSMGRLDEEILVISPFEKIRFF